MSDDIFIFKAKFGDELTEIELTREQAERFMDGEPITYAGEGDPFITPDGELGERWTASMSELRARREALRKRGT